MISSPRRAMLLRFQEMAAAEDVYTELQYQTQRLEFDYYALCVRHPSPLPGLNIASYHLSSGVGNALPVRKLFCDRSGIKAGKFQAGSFTLG